MPNALPSMLGRTYRYQDKNVKVAAYRVVGGQFKKVLVVDGKNLCKWIDFGELTPCKPIDLK